MTDAAIAISSWLETVSEVLPTTYVYDGRALGALTLSTRTA